MSRALFYQRPFNLFFEYALNWSSVITGYMMNCSFMYLYHLECHLTGPPEQGGQGSAPHRHPPPLPPPKVFRQCALFFEEPFKCAFFENIKSEIVNIQ